MIPRYIQDDPTLARVYDEDASERLLGKLSAKTVRDLLPKRKDRDDLPVVDLDATTVEIAAVMAQMRSPVVAVVDEHERVVGAVTVSRLFEQMFPDLPTDRGLRPVTTALVVVSFVAAYVLIATERIHRVAAALGGAAAMVVLGVVDAQVAFFSEETGVDWNVIFLLLGHDDHRRRAAPDRHLRVRRHLVGQARGRPAVRGDGDARRAHRRRLRAARQRHHGAAGRAGDRCWCASRSALRRCRS